MLRKLVSAANPRLPVVIGLSVIALCLAPARRATADDDANSAKINATAYLRVALSDKMLTPAGGQNGQTEYEIFKNTQRQLLLSPLVLRTALKQPGVAELAVIKNERDPADWLGRNLQVTFPGNAEIMKVSLAGGSRKELATLVNAVVDAYMGEVVGAERNRRDQRIGELKQIQLEKSLEVKDSLVELKRMAENLGISDSETLTLKQKNTLDELQNVRTELIRGQFELNRMNVELASQKALLEAVQSQPVSDVECELFASSDFILKKLQEDILNQEKSSDAKDQAELERLKKKYAERIEQIRAEITRKSLANAETDIKKLEAAIGVARKQQEVVQEVVKQLRKEADRFGMSSTDMQMRRAEAATREKTLDLITAEIEKLRIESLTQPRVTVVEKAEARE